MEGRAEGERRQNSDSRVPEKWACSLGGGVRVGLLALRQRNLSGRSAEKGDGKYIWLFPGAGNIGLFSVKWEVVLRRQGEPRL